MFAGLDEIDWDQLVHAYGEASDVPNDIRALVGSNEKAAKDALWRLFGNIYHQGTRYTATVPAIPYLVEAAVALEPVRAAAVLGLLSAIAEPAADRIYDDQMTIEAFRIDALEEEQALSEEELAERKKFGCPPTIESDVYDAVITQIPRLISELNISNRDVQIGLFELLGNSPQHSDDVKNIAEKALSSSKDDELLQVAIVECLSRLHRSVEVEYLGPVFEELSNIGSSPFLRAHIALAKSDIGDARVDELLNALGQAEKLYEIDRQSERGKGWTVSHIANALKPWAATEKNHVCEALMRSLPAARKWEADTSVVVDAIVFNLAYPEPTKNFFAKKLAKDLTSLERTALKYIIEFGSWKVGNNWSGNFTAQVASYGLPDMPNDLRRYLSAEKKPLTRWLKR